MCTLNLSLYIIIIFVKKDLIVFFTDGITSIKKRQHIRLYSQLEDQQVAPPT